MNKNKRNNIATYTRGKRSSTILGKLTLFINRNLKQKNISSKIVSLTKEMRYDHDKNAIKEANHVVMRNN